MSADRDEQPGFEVARRGYRTTQVDAWVERVRDVIEALETERDDARHAAASLQASLDDVRAREAAPDTFGARAERILRMAEHDAHLRRERAEVEAADIRELAHQEAERTIAQARAEAARVRADADRVRDDAERAFSRVRAEVAEARREADQRADTAASMHEHVQGLRGAVRGEIARLHAALGAELRALDTPAPAEPVTRVPEPRPVPAQAPAVAAAPAPASTDPTSASVVATDPTSRPAVTVGAAETADGPAATSADGPGRGSPPEPGPAATAGDDDAQEAAAETAATPVVVSLPVQRDRPGSPAAATTADRT